MIPIHWIFTPLAKWSIVLSNFWWTPVIRRSILRQLKAIGFHLLLLKIPDVFKENAFFVN